jgi:gliding motility-associated-like protein
VECNYTLLSGNRIQFKVKNYSPGATLVIDPTEKFCSFTGSRSDNWGYTATYDGGGNFYLGGIVLDETNQAPQAGPNGNGYLASPGAFQTRFQGGDGSEGDGYNYDVAIMKLNSSGTKRVYATYLGGSGDEQPHSMIVDNSGDLIVTGRTSSGNFPGSVFGGGGGFDLFVAEFNSSGTALLGSKRIGGSGWDGVNFAPKYLITGQFPEGAQQLRLNYGDDGRSEVILDKAGNVYIAACTQSSDFPVTGNVFQGSSGGGQDGVLLKLTPDLGTVLFSSYLGGSGPDAAFVLSLNPLDNTIWVAGGTMSGNFPGTGNAPVISSKALGGADGFVAVISNDGSQLLKSTYFGTGATDMIYGIDFDKFGFPYIVGTTDGVVPVVNSPFDQNNPTNSNGKQFITKLKQDLSGIVYSANFGPGNRAHPSISPTAFLVDRCQNVYVAGWGGGPDSTDRYANSGTWNMPITAGALKTMTDGEDFYFFVLQKNAASQLYGSYFGQQNGNFGDHVDGGTSRFDQQGVIYEAICANCYLGATFPTTPGVWASSNGAGALGCNEAGVKIAFEFAGVAAGLKVVTHGRGDSVGCVPLTASISDTIRNAKSYDWDFGDGTVINNTTQFSFNHTYTAVGVYRVMLVAIDSNTCNVADTAIKYVVVKNDPAYVDFRYDKIGPCESFDYVFTNLSTLGPGSPPFSDTAFTWTLGDGTVIANQNISYKPNHIYASPGPYKVTLALMDTSYCNYPLDTTRLLYVTANDTARFQTPKLGCAPYNAVFSNTSIGGQQFYWDFGDGSPIDSVDYSPTHLYPNVGTYTVTLKAVDSATCNIVSIYSFTITVQGKPKADFTYSPEPPQPPNTPTVFTDASTPGVKYEWFFGDGTSETKATPDTVVHLYNKTDTFQVCEVVTNASGCTDTACHTVPAVINPLLDVPNAFTPGRFGVNAVVKVVGFGITHMTWRIYNRWGQLVFESVNPYVGWDGYYHGVPQPMDVYAYTLEAEFSDGTHATKKGDITLIR